MEFFFGDLSINMPVVMIPVIIELIMIMMEIIQNTSDEIPLELMVKNH